MTDKNEPQQLVIPLHFTPVFNLNNFEVCPGNSEAFQFVKQLCHEEKAIVLYLYGATASGKTHLVRSLQKCKKSSPKQAKPTYLSFAEAPLAKLSNSLPREIPGHSPMLILEDVDRLHTVNDAEDAAFQLFNLFQHHQKQIVITSRVHPQDLIHIHDRLKSRFSSGAIIKIGLLDETTCIEIIKKLAADHQVSFPDRVIHFLIKRVPRNPSFIRTLFHAIDEYSLRTQKPISIRLVKKVVHLSSKELDFETGPRTA